MSDNEHAAAALWNSEVLSVKNPVGEPIPEFPQEPEEDSKRSSVVKRQEAEDVLEDHPAGAYLTNKAEADECQVAARVIQTEPPAGDREGLAGGSKDDKGNSLDCVGIDPLHVAVIDYVRKPRGEDRRREWVDLGAPAPVNPRRGDLGGTDAGEERRSAH
jgi:hypothetical protein